MLDGAHPLSVGSVADALEKLSALRTSGDLTVDEYDTLKQKLIARAI